MQTKGNSLPKMEPRPVPEVKSTRELKNLTSNDSKAQFTPIPSLDQLKIVNRLISFLEAK